jgi:O-antigen/teichoic acid export membrane protein
MIEFLKEVSIYGFGDLVFRFVGYASFLIYARLFSPYEFGILALVVTIGSVVSIFQELGLNNATQRFYLDPKLHGNRPGEVVSTCLTLLLVWSALLSGIGILCLYPLREALVSRYGIVWTLVALTLISNVPAQLLLYSQNMMRIHFSPWKFTFLSFCKNLVSLSFSLVLILFFEMGLPGFFVGECVALVLSAPLSLSFIRKDLQWGFDKKIAAELFRFGYPFIFAGMGYWLFVSMDRWMLGVMSGNEEVGFYSVASRFGMLVLFVNEVFGKAWPPYALKLYAEDSRYREIYGRVFSYWFFFMTLLGVSISLFSPEIVRLSTPEAYWRSAAPLSVLTIAFVFSSTTQITALGISLERRTGLFFTGAWGTAVINFFLNLTMIPRWGALGASLATLASYVVLSGYYLCWTQKLHPFPLERTKLSILALINGLGLLVSLNLSLAPASLETVLWKAGICLSILVIGVLADVVRVSDLIRVAEHLWPRRQKQRS